MTKLNTRSEIYLNSLKKQISKAISDFMKENNVGFNELSRKLKFSASHLVKVKKGKANLTLSSIARISAVINKKPSVF